MLATVKTRLVWHIWTRLMGFWLLAIGHGLPLFAQPIAPIVPDGHPHSFTARDHQFWLDGRPTLLVAGEMHFGRVQPEEWETRIKQARAMGLNTLSFYLFWNQVEPRPGKFVFKGMTDVRRVLKLCQANGMWAILRPGPYCCAEIEYGGIPWWTLQHPEVRVRTDDPRWLAWCSNYLAAVHRQVADLDVCRGGPLLMEQVENEYGLVNPTNNHYLVALTRLFRQTGYAGQLFTCDPTTQVWSHPELRVPGLLYGRNGLDSDRKFAASQAAIGDYPVYVPEIYTAWFSGWGEPVTTKNASVPALCHWVDYLLDHRDSFCFYMFFGGSNYGYANGCNEYLPVQTSYDYSAPVDEAGRSTEKFRALRALLTERLHLHPPEPPAEPPVMALPAIHLTESASLLATLPRQPKLTTIGRPPTMEELGQGCGFVLYRKIFAPGKLHGRLQLNGARDYTVVMVNGQTIANAYVGNGLDSNQIDLPETTGPATLDLLVYNLGRISVIVSEHTQDLARKGLTGEITLDGTGLNREPEWQVYPLPYEQPPHFHAGAGVANSPAFYRGTFRVDQAAGTFLDLSNWHFGVTWVNGHNLGRFWDHGGLRSLFLPRQWLRPGRNELVLLELGPAPARAEVTGTTHIVTAPAVPFAVSLDQNPLQPPPH